MPSIINATTSTGLVSSADNSGSLQLATNNGTTAVTVDTSQNLMVNSTTLFDPNSYAASGGKFLQVKGTTTDRGAFLNLLGGGGGANGYWVGGVNYAVSGQTYPAASIFSYTGTTATSGILGFTTSSDTTSPPTERMRIASDGTISTTIGSTLYGAYPSRAWVNFNGTGTVAIRQSRNVSSITDNGTGDYTVNFTQAMPDAEYMATQSCGNNNWGVMAIPAATNSTSSLLLQSTTQYRVYSSAASGGTSNTDVAVMFVAIFR
jgi:hypothetical protein